MRSALRTAGDAWTLHFRAPRRLPLRLVVIADHSGSMEAYSRAILLYVHAAMGSLPDMEVFVFATRLSRLTHQLRRRDPDEALTLAGRDINDWGGGTRIGENLKTFNQLWGRRVLAQGAVVALITDGLERGDPDLLAAQARRLKLNARRLIWLDPLLRYSNYQPLSTGARILDDIVSAHLPVHNQAALESLAAGLHRL